MNNLDKIEKRIVDYLINTNSINEDDTGSFQRNPSNLKDLIFQLFQEDKLLRDAGLLIDFSSPLNEVKGYLMEKKNNESVILYDKLKLQRLVFLLTKMINFISQLEVDGYIEAIDNIFNLENQTMEIHIPHISIEDYYKSLEINNSELLSDLIDGLGYYYLSTEKLIRYKSNGYKTDESITASNEVFISYQNIRIAKFGLYTSIFSTLISLIAIILTIYNSMKPSTLKIDESQFNSVKEYFKTESSLLKKDSIQKFQ